MLVTGSAQVVSILVSIAKMKALAILLGPSGIGLLSIYNSLQGMAQQAAGLGLGSSGVRQIAASQGDEVIVSRVRRVLFIAHLVQGLLALSVMWVLREKIAIWLFEDALRATEVGLVGVAVLAGLLGTAQTALLRGMRRVGDLGWVTVIGASIGALLGLVAVWVWDEGGLIWFVLVQPLATITVARHYTSRLPRPQNNYPRPLELWHEWLPMARLGAAFMMGGLATTATLLLVRGRIAQELGLDAAGHFAAAWGITMTYVGFLLGAMGADYYPRLAEVIHDKVAAVRLMNDQAQLSLAVGGPVLLLLIGLAPWLVTLLYAEGFEPTVELVQWQTVGNVFKLASWALGFSIAAAARSKTFLFVQLNFNILFLLIFWSNLEFFGLQATGPAFTLAYILHFFLLHMLARRIHGFRWQSLSLNLLALHGGLATALLIFAFTHPFAGALASVLLFAATGLFGLRLVLTKIGPGGEWQARLTSFFSAIGWPVPKTS